MPQVVALSPYGQPLARAARGDDALDLLWAAGVECGRWAPPLCSASKLPHLTHARDLLALQRRYGATVTQHRGSRGPAPAVDLAEDHVHDDREVRVVLAGALVLLLRVPTLGGWVLAGWDALEWYALPAGLPHALASPGLQARLAGELNEEGANAASLDLLCLFAQPGGWRTRATGVQLPCSQSDAPGRRSWTQPRGCLLLPATA